MGLDKIITARAVLNSSQTQKSNNALYQAINAILDELSILDKIITGNGNVSSGGGAIVIGGGGGGSGLVTHAPTHEFGGNDIVDVKKLGGYPANPAVFLSGNATFITPPGGGGGGSGDVVGPASAVNDNIAVYDGTTGKLIKDGGTSVTTINNKINAVENENNAQDALINNHNIRHQTGGGDVVDVKLLGGFPNNTTTFLRGDGTFNAIPSSDEVFVGPSDPGSPPYELWYDVDEPAVPITGHHLTHEQGGTDAIKLDDLALPDDNLDLNASGSRHGLLQKLIGDNLRYLDSTGTWYYVRPPAGVLAAQPVGLGIADAGLIWYVLAPYFHAVRWTGTIWEFAPGDGGNGFYQYFSIVPQTGGWIHANGVVTDYLVVGGATLTVAAVTLPNLSTGSYFRNAIWSGGSIIGASGITGGSGVIGGSTSSDGIHNHTADAAIDGAHSHNGSTDSHSGHAHAISTFFLEYDHGGSGVNIPNSNTAGGGAHSHTLSTDSQGSHTHGITIGNAGAHSHSVSVNNHTHTLSGIEPLHVDVSVYFRR